MNLKEINNLTELFFHQAEKQNPDSAFLEWLNKINRKKFTWSQTVLSVFKLAKTLRIHVNKGDRILLLSENRPEWLIADISIMLAGAITVPAYTTYTEEDYRYLIEDCSPSIIIISNNTMNKKLEIAVISTGNEIIKSGDKLENGLVYDSNGPMIFNLCLETGNKPFLHKIIKDNPKILKKRLSNLIKKFDMIIFTGGASEGDEDHIKSVIEEMSGLIAPKFF